MKGSTVKWNMFVRKLTKDAVAQALSEAILLSDSDESPEFIRQYAGYLFVTNNLWAMDPYYLEEKTGISHVVFETLGQVGPSSNLAVAMLLEHAGVNFDSLAKEVLHFEGGLDAVLAS